MLVGALADAGADQKAIADAVHSLNAGAVVSFEKVKRRGVGATKYHVHTADGPEPGHQHEDHDHAHEHEHHDHDHEEHGHDHAHEPHGGHEHTHVREHKHEHTHEHAHKHEPHEHQHRGLPEIVALIEKAGLTPRARRNSIAVFQRLGEAEAYVHQVAIEQVHFHEVGAVDSIADIVGACVAFDLLDVNSIVCSPINVGSGTVKTDHGILPVPAPATARLLIGAPIYSRGPAKELATPTGAAVAVTLAKSFGVMPPMTVKATGHGAGGHDFPDQPNVLRVILGEPTGAGESLTVSIIEANMDDMNPQVLAYACERLMSAGALDVSLQPIVMKKGRAGQLLRVIARPEDREALAGMVFAETSTFGLRMFAAERRVQSRDWVEVATRHGVVRVKVAGDGAYAPEYEDCRKLAQASGAALKEIIAEANCAYLNRTK
jgi:pyridinium-3,5-bisthiocarboxylic acid mononucleotide nickel chelatase